MREEQCYIYACRYKVYTGLALDRDIYFFSFFILGGACMKDKTKKIIKLTVGIAIVGGVAYIIYDNYNKDKIIKQLTADNKELEHRVTILEEIVSEDVLEEAIATTTRKLNYREDKVKVYELREGPENLAKLNEHKMFRDLFRKRLKDFNELKALRYIEK